MRISTKLALGLTLTSAGILGSYGYRQLQEEEADLRAATENDLKLLGTAVQVAVENALRDHQVADISEILESLELKDATFDVFVFDAGGHISANSWGSKQSLPFVADVVAETSRSRHAEVRFVGRGGLSHLVAAFPLRGDDDSNQGVLALVRPLDELRDDLSATAVSTLVSIFTLFAAIATVGWLLVHLNVQRPLTRLIEAIGAVGAGDLSTSVVIQRHDEIGRVAVEFNAMVKELAETRRRLLAEAEARSSLETGLQRVDKMVTVGQLSAGLAHEIGSPLQILNGRARALAGRSDISPEVRRTVEILVEQTDRITDIVTQLLNFARRKSAQLGETDVSAATRTIVDLLEPETRRRAVAVEFEVAEDLPRILADADRIQQLALNLLTNALRATPDGGRVRVALQRSQFADRTTGQDRPCVSLVVEDTGAGMEEQVLERIFEPFFTTWEAAGGTGLGLAVVKAIVNEHGGVLSVSSKKDVGTRFSVSLPLKGRASSQGMVA